MSAPRILFFDIESTQLKGDFGSIIAFGYKTLGNQDATVLSTLDFTAPCHVCGVVNVTDDTKIVAAARRVLAQADMWVTWYGKGFDWKFLNTRLLDARLGPLPATPHVDLYFTAKHNLALSSNRLASVQDFLGLPTSKTPLTRRVWRRAAAGSPQDIEYIIDHCRKDVLVLEEAYHALRPYVRQHPRVGRYGEACRVCGNTTLIRNQQRLTVTKGPRVQLKCTQCGHYETRAILKSECVAQEEDQWGN